MKPLSILLLSLILLFAYCSNPSKQATPVADTAKKIINSKYAGDISMINLIANPEKYEGYLVRVHGYLNLQFESDRLYFHKEDYNNSIRENSLWVSGRGDEKFTEAMKCNNHYVLIEGTFSNINGGLLENIDRIEIWERPLTPPKEAPKPAKQRIKFPPPNN
ncbi:MAG: hypothetical protein EOP47_18305 [Sphingobacteriaceae bacterium]|nr:MAG: hypothetical protein EOP47_18305 [Sphingobacteriaceae bacterium]